MTTGTAYHPASGMGSIQRAAFTAAAAVCGSPDTAWRLLQSRSRRRSEVTARRTVAHQLWAAGYTQTQIASVFAAYTDARAVRKALRGLP